MKKNLLILGVNGMLGHNLFRYFYYRNKFNTYGLLRDREKILKDKFLYLNENIQEIESEEIEKINEKLSKWNINVVINCIGIVKQSPNANYSEKSIKINSLFPHELNSLCSKLNIRLIHISTDCIFSGKKGFYDEEDYPDSLDLYGRTKFLGELSNSNAITLRTSFIGKELSTNYGLLNWFLSQEGKIKGFSIAIYSGVPTCELGRIIENYVLPNKCLKGLYNVSADPINKFTLLNIFKEVYKKNIIILKDETYKIDRSLNSKKFRKATGYKPLEWFKAIEKMKEFDKLKL